MDLLFRICVIPGVVFMGMTLLGAPLTASLIGCGIGALCAIAGCGRS